MEKFIDPGMICENKLSISFHYSIISVLLRSFYKKKREKEKKWYGTTVYDIFLEVPTVIAEMIFMQKSFKLTLKVSPWLKH